MDLHSLGWNEKWAAKMADYTDDGLAPARVVREDRGRYQLLSGDGDCSGETTGRFRFQAEDPSQFPTTGDWVVVGASGTPGHVLIHALLPRQSAFTRRAVTTGRTEEQTLAANVDTVFLMSGLDVEYNPRRIERYVTIAWDSGALPVILLNKADLIEDPQARIDEVRSVARQVPVHVLSARDGKGIDQVRTYLRAGSTYAFLGSSGVGKSTLVNALLGEKRQAVTEISNWNRKGVHTTTTRELIILPEGGVLIDTPGMKTIQPWTDDEGLEKTFADIEELAVRCRFRDCQHVGEPGCAVQAAIDAGDLEAKRLVNYKRLAREASKLAAKKARNKQISQWRKVLERKRRDEGQGASTRAAKVDRARER